MYANDVKKPDNLGKQRGVRGNQVVGVTPGGIKSLDVAHWAKNIPQQIRDDITATSNRGGGGGQGFMGMGSNSISYIEPSTNMNEETRYGQRSGRGGPGIN